MKYTTSVILALSLNLALCKEEQSAAQARVKRQFWPGMGPGMGSGMWPGMGSGAGNGQGQMCSCDQIRRKRDTEELETSPDKYADEDITKIVGGQPTRPGEYPSAVLVLLDGSQHCDGTIINQWNILTAAHCVQGRDDATRFSVVAGAHNIQQQEPSRVTIPVASARYHPNYNSGGRYNNDVAVLRLSQALRFGDRIKPVCLPRFRRNFDGASALVAGWGKTAESGSSSPVLQHVMVPVMSNTMCTQMMEQRYTITENMLCAGFPQGGRDSCGGDSGGPMYLDGNRGMLQVGIVSFGEGCARPNRPGVYTRLDRVMNFVMQNSGIGQQGCSAYVM